MDESEHTMTLKAESTPLQQDAFAGSVWRHRTLLPRERVAAAAAPPVALTNDSTVAVGPDSCSLVVDVYSAASSAQPPAAADGARACAFFT
jgi:hypothetical protein